MSLTKTMTKKSAKAGLLWMTLDDNNASYMHRVSTLVPGDI